MPSRLCCGPLRCQKAVDDGQSSPDDKKKGIYNQLTRTLQIASKPSKARSLNLPTVPYSPYLSTTALPYLIQIKKVAQLIRHIRRPLRQSNPLDGKSGH